MGGNVPRDKGTKGQSKILAPKARIEGTEAPKARIKGTEAPKAQIEGTEASKTGLKLRAEGANRRDRSAPKTRPKGQS